MLRPAIPGTSVKRTSISIFVCSFMAFARLAVTAQAQIQLTFSPYTQDFDTLGASGTSSLVPLGWAFSESGTAANTTYAAGSGTSNAGDTYSFGTGTALDRAFGGLQTGSLIPTIGANFQNNTGVTITELDISYFGEQWRLGALSRTDMLDFQFSLDATSLTTGTWLDVNQLDFIAPISSGSVGALDGNAAANRVGVSFNITSLSIANGAQIWIRWNDFNATSNDDGLGIDNFLLQAVPEPATSMLIGAGLLLVAQRFIRRKTS
jgi:PEP-CTERM motif-containing protein